MEELLRYAHESPARRRSERSRPLVLAVALALTVAGAPEARADHPRPTDDPRAPRILTPGSSLFGTDYLVRALQAPPQSGDTVQSYAKRYGIPRDLAQKILDGARAEGLDPELGFRLVRTESRFSTNARGPGGALGLLQLMPSTARVLDRSLRTEDQILEPANNLRLGFRYLRQMIERYDGDVRLGLLAYNRGENAVDRALRNGRDPENGYSSKVLGTKGSNPYEGKGLLKEKK